MTDLADRTMVISRVIAAPVATVWGAWWNAESLPHWWGPDGFSCRTARIDLRAGGEWVFDMIGPDGRVVARGLSEYPGIAPTSLADAYGIQDRAIALAGGQVAGKRTGTVFIENGRFHGEQIAKAIAGQSQ